MGDGFIEKVFDHLSFLGEISLDDLNTIGVAILGEEGLERGWVGVVLSRYFGALL